MATRTTTVTRTSTSFLSSSASASSGTFSFGKHKGKTFEEVMKSDPGYCQWALGMDSPSGSLKAFVDFLREKAPQGAPGGGQALPWGTKQASGQDGPSSAANPDFVYVCELIAADKFSVRVEKSAQALANEDGKGAGSYIPPHLWQILGRLEGALQIRGEKAFAFHLSVYDKTIARLRQMGEVEPIPSWVRKMAKPATASKAVPDLGALPEGMRSRLLEYQREGIEFGLQREGRCLIGDEMGLGKTVQALAVVSDYAQEWPILIICPGSLRWLWKEQIVEWLPELVAPDEVQVIRKGADDLRKDVKIWVISYGLLATEKTGKFLKRPSGSPHQVVIVDESHNIKDWGAARTKVVVPLLRNARRAILLSGTPTRNAPDELHPQLSGLLPNFAPKLADFRARYCVQKPSFIPGGRSILRVAGARNKTELNFVLKESVMIRRLKKDVLAQLPPKRRQRVPIEISDNQLVKEFTSSSQYALDLASIESEDRGSLFARMAKAKIPAVKEYLQEVLDRSEEKAIIFAHHRIMMDEISKLLEKELPKEQKSYIRIDGSTPGAKRLELVKKFQEEEACRIALLSITACGEGLTLTAAGHVIFAELSWVPGAVEQAEARAHRIGTNHNKILVDFLVVPNSPDEQIYRSLERKKKDTSHVLDGVAATLMAPLKTQEVKEPEDKARQLDIAAALSAVPVKKRPRKVEAPRALSDEAEEAEAPGKKLRSLQEEGQKVPPAELDRLKVQYLLSAIKAGG